MIIDEVCGALIFKVDNIFISVYEFDDGVFDCNIYNTLEEAYKDIIG